MQDKAEIKIFSDLHDVYNRLEQLENVTENDKNIIKYKLEEISDSIDLFKVNGNSKDNFKKSLGFLLYNFHKTKSFFFEKIGNDASKSVQHKLMLNYSMYENEEIAIDAISEPKSSTLTSISPVEELTSNLRETSLIENINTSLLDEETPTSQNISYQDILNDLNEPNLLVKQESNDFKIYFESINTTKPIKPFVFTHSIRFYTQINELKLKLLHLIDKDLVSLREKQENLKKQLENLKEQQNLNEETIIDHDLNEETKKTKNLVEKLNELRDDEVVVYFENFQTDFLNWSLNLSEKEMMTQFYYNTANPRLARDKYHKFAILFHPDKNASNKESLHELFLHLKILKDKIDDKFNMNKKSYVNYREEGQSEFNIALDYFYCSKRMFNQVKFLDIDNIDLEYTEENRNNYYELSKRYFGMAYDKFRDACYIAEREKNYEEMLNLRILMSNCFEKILYRKLDAQLAALGCLYLVTKRFPEYYNDDQKRRAQENFDKIKGVEQNVQTTSEKKTASRNLSLIASNSKSQSHLSETHRIEVFKKIVRVDKSLIESIDAEKNTVKYELLKNGLKKGALALGFKVVPGIVGSLGALALTGGIVGHGSLIFTSLAFIAPTTICISLMVGSLFLMNIGQKHDKRLTVSALNYQKELKIRENLDKIVQNSIECFDKEDIEAFLVCLTEGFEEKNDDKVRLIYFDIEKKIFQIDPQHIIANMHKHGFKPEAIAFLLNLLFEALLAVLTDKRLLEQFNKMGVADSKIKTTISDLLDAIVKEPIKKSDINLEKEAEKLDNILREMQSRIVFDDGSMFGKMRNIFHSLKYYITTDGMIDYETIKNSREITFKTRFYEVRNIAKINKVIYSLLVEYEKPIFLEQAVEEIQKSLSQFHYISKANSRLEILKDFIWLFTGEEWLKAKLQEDIEPSKEFESNVSQPFLQNLNINLKKLLDEINQEEDAVHQSNRFTPIQTINIWQQLKKKYRAARDLKAADELNALNEWEKNTNSKSKLDSNDIQTLKAKLDLYVAIDLGYARACLNLAEYSKCLKFLESKKNHLFIIKNWEFWQIGAKAHRKMCKYDKAKKFIDQSSILTNNRKPQEELELIQKLTNENTQDFLKSIRSTKPLEKQQGVNLKELNDFYKKMHGKDRVNYNILSLDGGGLRGIIPCVWLNEIEMRTHKPISHMFHMIAGTSTGAIIGSALSLPRIVNGQYKIPRFTASEILDIYIQQGSTIFSDKKDLLKRFFQPAYSSLNRSQLMESFEFKNYRLSDSLTELVIPAFPKEDPTRSFVFSTKHAAQNPRLNFTYYDCCMATSAAPTFFEPHQINGFGFFVDGGISHNDPAVLAYHESSMSSIKDNDLFVLSLGTGCNISKFKNSGGGFVDFGLNTLNYMFSSQSGDVEAFMSRKLGKRYERWQVVTENEISLDDYSKDNINVLIDIARQYLEELYIADDNYFNKLLERLEHSNNNKLIFDPYQNLNLY